ncbi:hypothetical protein QQ045_003869 [Rhodiola kirilowii]
MLLSSSNVQLFSSLGFAPRGCSWLVFKDVKGMLLGIDNRLEANLDWGFIASGRLARYVARYATLHLRSFPDPDWMLNYFLNLYCCPLVALYWLVASSKKMGMHSAALFKNRSDGD